MFCAFLNGYYEVVKFLINNNANLNYQYKNGYSLLHYAVVYKNQILVEHLLEKGINKEIKDDQSQTALDIALKNGCTQLVHILK